MAHRGRGLELGGLDLLLFPGHHFDVFPRAEPRIGGRSERFPLGDRGRAGLDRADLFGSGDGFGDGLNNFT